MSISICFHYRQNGDRGPNRGTDLLVVCGKRFKIDECASPHGGPTNLSSTTVVWFKADASPGSPLCGFDMSSLSKGSIVHGTGVAAANESG